MTIIEVMTLFGIMVVLSAAPSASVALVITRSATLGMANGLAVAFGIILGDLIFITLAILGLSFIAETMGGIFTVIKYFGATYLLWFGFTLLSPQNNTIINVSNISKRRGLLTGFLTGIILTLGDIKAIIFYVSLFPLFIDLSALRVTDILIIVGVTIVAVGGVKVIYAMLALKVINLARKFKLENTFRKIAGGAMIGSGSYLILKT